MIYSVRKNLKELKNWYFKASPREETPLPDLEDYLSRLQNKYANINISGPKLLKTRLKFQYLLTIGYFAKSNARILEFLEFVFLFSSLTRDNRVSSRTVKKARAIINKMSKIPEKKGKLFYFLFVASIAATVLLSFFINIQANNNIIFMYMGFTAIAIFIILWDFSMRHKSDAYESFRDACDEYFKQTTNYQENHTKNSHPKKENVISCKDNKQFHYDLLFLFSILYKLRYIEAKDKTWISEFLKHNYDMETYMSESTIDTYLSKNDKYCIENRERILKNIKNVLDTLLNSQENIPNIDQANQFRDDLLEKLPKYGINFTSNFLYDNKAEFPKIIITAFCLSHIYSENKKKVDEEYSREIIKEAKLKINYMIEDIWK